jgi:putative ABC transport system permease protein
MSDPASGSNRSFAGLALLLARSWWPQLAALAFACGIVAMTIAGALGVGDAMEAGLRQLAIGRLGRINAAVASDRFFTLGLAERLQAARGATAGPATIVPAIVLPVTVTVSGSAARATLLACNDPAGLGFEPAPPPLAPASVFVNQPLAETLGLTAGDGLVLRLPRRSLVPADSPLGRRSSESDGRRLTVAAVLPAGGLGSFSLRPSLATGPLVVTSLDVAQAILRRGKVATMAFASGHPADGDTPAWLAAAVEPALADLGLAFESLATDPPSLRLVADRLILPPAADEAAAKVLGPLGGEPTLAFLATALTPLDGPQPARASIPYSTVLGIATTRLPVGDLVDQENHPLPQPADDEILIDRWMADDLAAQGRPVAVGDTLRLGFFEPETTGSRVVEATADLRIAGIAAMRGAAVARPLVPEVEGITDEASIADWDPPFPFDATRVRSTPPHDEDDQYWKAHGATPKAFVSLATARRLAGSRFGATTAWFVPGGGAVDAEALAGRLAAAMPAESLGLRVLPLRAEAEAASQGSTPFGSLFLALSSFVLGAGLVLEGLLVSLLVAARRRDLGILAAVGFGPGRIACLLLTGGGVAAALGVAVGSLLGPFWARALLAWLAATWNSEVGNAADAAFAGSTAGGGRLGAAAAAAFGISLLTLAWSAWRAAAIPPLRLLRGRQLEAGRGSGRLARSAAALGLTLAAVAAAVGRASSAATAVGLFFASGFGGLVGLLALVRLWLAAAMPAASVRRLDQLARRNLASAPGRAFSIAAIVATASFLIVAVSSFAQRPPVDATARSSPTGGWSEIVTFGSATSVDPTTPETRGSLGLTADQEAILAKCTIARLRTSDGDDAACTNLYASLRPTVIGVGPDFIDRGGFRFLAHALLPAGSTNPWQLLDEPQADAATPVILDQATAQWALKLGGVGSHFPLPDDAGQPVDCVIVGLLEPGILQGRVIVAEQNFARIFPDRSGYGMALIDAGALPAELRIGLPRAVAAVWADTGVMVEAATKRLASLQAVQNTFLSGFQVLGTLGLLLGTAGVAAVQLQGVCERIGQLAVLRAVGFTLRRVRWMLVLETLVTVALGLAAGIAAATLAVAPALTGGEARLPLAWIAITVVATLATAAVAAGLAASRGTIPSRPPRE